MAPERPSGEKTSIQKWQLDLSKLRKNLMWMLLDDEYKEAISGDRWDLKYLNYTLESCTIILKEIPPEKEKRKSSSLIHRYEFQVKISDNSARVYSGGLYHWYKDVIVNEFAKTYKKKATDKKVQEQALKEVQFDKLVLFHMDSGLDAKVLCSRYNSFIKQKQINSKKTKRFTNNTLEEPKQTTSNSTTLSDMDTTENGDSISEPTKITEPPNKRPRKNAKTATKSSLSKPSSLPTQEEEVGVDTTITLPEPVRKSCLESLFTLSKSKTLPSSDRDVTEYGGDATSSGTNENTATNISSSSAVTITKPQPTSNPNTLKPNSLVTSTSSGLSYKRPGRKLSVPVRQPQTQKMNQSTFPLTASITDDSDLRASGSSSSTETPLIRLPSFLPESLRNSDSTETLNGTEKDQCFIEEHMKTHPISNSGKTNLPETTFYNTDSNKKKTNHYTDNVDDDDDQWIEDSVNTALASADCATTVMDENGVFREETSNNMIRNSEHNIGGNHMNMFSTLSFHNIRIDTNWMELAKRQEDLLREIVALQSQNNRLSDDRRKDYTTMQDLERIRTSLEMQIQALKTCCATSNRQLIDKDAEIADLKSQIQTLKTRQTMMEERLATRNTEIQTMKCQVYGHLRFMRQATNSVEKLFGPYGLDISASAEGGLFVDQNQASGALE